MAFLPSVLVFRGSAILKLKIWGNGMRFLVYRYHPIYVLVNADIIFSRSTNSGGACADAPSFSFDCWPVLLLFVLLFLLLILVFKGPLLRYSWPKNDFSSNKNHPDNKILERLYFFIWQSWSDNANGTRNSFDDEMAPNKNWPLLEVWAYKIKHVRLHPLSLLLETQWQSKHRK